MMMCASLHTLLFNSGLGLGVMDLSSSSVLGVPRGRWRFTLSSKLDLVQSPSFCSLRIHYFAVYAILGLTLS